jgi:hypothetical protein
MERIIVAEAVAQKIEALVDVLFDKGYFAIKENAVKYVTLLKNFINTVPEKQRHPTKTIATENGTAAIHPIGILPGT